MNIVRICFMEMYCSESFDQWHHTLKLKWNRLCCNPPLLSWAKPGQNCKYGEEGLFCSCFWFLVLLSLNFPRSDFTQSLKKMVSTMLITWLRQSSLGLAYKKVCSSIVHTEFAIELKSLWFWMKTQRQMNVKTKFFKPLKHYITVLGFVSLTLEKGL